jgi:eukaryotic-like serine/threonine-protein kinase
MIVRLVFFVLALPLLGLGGFGLAAGFAPKSTPVAIGKNAVVAIATITGKKPKELEGALAGTPLKFVLSAVGLALLFLAVKPSGGGGGREEKEPKGKGKSDGGVAKVPRKLARKAKGAASKAARKGQYSEAGEICFHSGQLEKAAEYFEKGEDYERAAEIMNSLGKLDRCCELYMKGGKSESAGVIYAQQKKFDLAADAYKKAGKTSVAAEMYDKAEKHLEAGRAYVECSFHRQAAAAFAKAKAWDHAAKSMEEVVLEETSRSTVGVAPEKEREVRNLVLQAAKYYEQAGDRASSLRVLKAGGCYLAAAELAVRLGEHGQAAEMFLKARDPKRAAESLKAAGRGEEAARILGEHLRDKGDHADAAASLEQAGEHLAAGDLYRQLERFENAGACYERAGDFAQAGEMFRLNGDLPKAAALFGQMGHWDDAAQCYEQAGDVPQQAHALLRATRFLKAGELFFASGQVDEAIEALQQVDAQSSDFPAASARLGEIFSKRGEHGLGVAKLEQAVGKSDPTRETIEAHYRLAVALEESDRAAEAVMRYEKILGVGYKYKDVEQRLAATKEKAQAQAKAKAAAAAAPPGTSATARPTRYKVLSELGRGGMGIVYKAHDTVLDRAVALKVLPEQLAENAQALQNFLREAKSAAKLNHPNIVTVFDAGEQNGRYYIAMEYVDGTTLKDVIKKKGPIAPGGVLNVLLQMCEALGYAHENKVVHRDVKTANTMWTKDRKAKIMDFGLAKVVEEVRNHTTIVSGTPYYMSPEQTLGKNVDHRTDIYSLGVSIFELATGTVPFREGNIPYHHVHTPPPDPREINPEIPGLIAQIVAKCMAKDPDQRFQTTRELSTRVKEALARSQKKPA